ncbi:MAG: hypothetical protein QNJ46_09150 [Leptolyngbyaceae cyanobacterium MO_188.B28]|nr:hypothetical protein [Leptolyngbyaceae cyanobacterium MO_188.B28]
MLRQDTTSIGPRQNGSANFAGGAPAVPAINGVGKIDIQQELDKIEEIVLDSPRIFPTRRTLVDEEQLLDQLDLIRLNLPSSFREAVQIVQRREEILLEAEQIAQEMVTTAEQQAAQLMDELGIRRQAELEAQQIRRQVQQECEVMRAKTAADIEEMRRQAQQEWEDLRTRSLAESESIQNDADAYADRVLMQMEQQFTEMLRVLHNGRQRLQPKSADPVTASPPSPKGREANHSNNSRPSPSSRSDRLRRK